VWTEVEPEVLYEKRGFAKLKDAERNAFHQRRMLKEFFAITITAGDDFEKQLTILVGSKHREIYGT
jgi:hypothetical protein